MKVAVKFTYCVSRGPESKLFGTDDGEASGGISDESKQYGTNNNIDSDPGYLPISMEILRTMADAGLECFPLDGVGKNVCNSSQIAKYYCWDLSEGKQMSYVEHEIAVTRTFMRSLTSMGNTKDLEESF